MCFLRLDGWARDTAPVIDELVIGELERGRRSRAIYQAPVFHALRPSAVARASAGEEVRLLAARTGGEGDLAGALRRAIGEGPRGPRVLVSDLLTRASTVLGLASTGSSTGRAGLAGRFGRV